MGPFRSQLCLLAVSMFGLPPAQAQCATYTKPNTMIVFAGDLGNLLNDGDDYALRLKPAGASAPFLSVDSMSEFRAKLKDWANGAAPAPELSISRSQASEAFSSGDIASLGRMNGLVIDREGSNLPDVLVYPSGPGGRPGIDTPFPTTPRGGGTPPIVLPTGPTPPVPTGGDLDDIIRQLQPVTPNTPLQPRGKGWNQQVIGKDERVPASEIKALPSPGPRPNNPGSLPALGEKTIPASIAALLPAVVGVINTSSDGAQEFCTAVHVGDGRFLTALHCANKPMKSRTLLFGDTFSKDGKLVADMTCTARVGWPSLSTVPQVDVAELSIAQQAPPRLPPEFVSSQFSKTKAAVAPLGVWPSLSVLTAVQVAYPTQSGVNTVIKKVESGAWTGSMCKPKPPLDPQILAGACASASSDAGIASVGEPHGCDADPGGSGMPLFADLSGRAVLVGVHRGGPGFPGSQNNINCAVAADQMRKLAGFGH